MVGCCIENSYLNGVHLRLDGAVKLSNLWKILKLKSRVKVFLCHFYSVILIEIGSFSLNSIVISWILSGNFERSFEMTYGLTLLLSIACKLVRQLAFLCAYSINLTMISYFPDVNDIVFRQNLTSASKIITMASQELVLLHSCPESIICFVWVGQVKHELKLWFYVLVHVVKMIEVDELFF